MNCSVAPSETGIFIEASNVYLNLQGHTISGPGCSTDAAVPSTIGINVGASDVHIINGTARALTAGILILGTPAAPATHSHLSNLTLRESCTGLAMRDANDNHVSGSNNSANAGEGVLLINANHNVIDSNVINDNDPPGGGVAGSGLNLSNSDDNTITSNEFSRNGQAGVYVVANGSNHNTIRGNIVKDTGSDGISVSGNNNTIQENTLRENAVGIALAGFSSENFVYRNRARENSNKDFTDTDCHDNTWTNNIFRTDSEGDGPGAGCIR